MLVPGSIWFWGVVVGVLALGSLVPFSGMLRIKITDWLKGKGWPK
jgi:hypothetical protein